ncbi:MAG: hybrid sensor histidine kinase/response regulator transcription factor, partial [Bacteroidota bacterium]
MQSISAEKGLRLRFDENVVELGFAAIDPGAAHLIDYLYRLEGLEEAWVQSNGRRFVRYPGLSPGKYVFRVKAVNKFGRWPDQEIALAVLIPPPWWRTTWAYAAYGLLMIGLLYSVYRVRLQQVHLQQKLKMEHFQREHLAEMDRLKSRFFANISHEFRTPLTLILGPIQKWRERAHEEDEKKDLSMAERSAHRLLRLINQLLDLSKLEAGATKLRAGRMNIVSLVKGFAYSFESSAGMRDIALNVCIEEEAIDVYCDRDLVEKIVSNLLSNAFKFTSRGGTVTVGLNRSVASSSRQGREGDEEKLVISVSDTGIGIPPDEVEKVFDRFYQVDASQTREHEGSGLGLALVKELVELHHGTIEVQSEVGKGTTFTVRLPMGRGHLKDDEIIEVPIGPVTEVPEGEGTFVDKVSGEETKRSDSLQTNGERPIVLVIEDNADVRSYIRDCLDLVYQVREARDGLDGVEKALEIIPDLVISDVMMPKKDGYEVCRTLKLDEKTSHIPIILLTAKAASENKIEGLEIGADDYLIKPFEPKELLARVKNLIELRRKLRERFKASVPLKPGEIAVTSMDDTFLKKVIAAVEQHIGDEQFDINALGALVGMSRRQLHRKLTALTNQGPGEFIRHIRLHRAMDLLQKGAGTVS